ncbi:MAG: GGDEF domain-containing protein [Oligoflexales bacterium]|nr:GGDEF domain-containing protein [Oligoflexales bacterium]
MQPSNHQKNSNSYDDLVQTFSQHESFCKSIIDGYLLLDNNSKPLKCNALFSQILNIKTKLILKSDKLSDILVFIHKGIELSFKDLLDSKENKFEEIVGICKDGPEKGTRFNLILGIHRFLDSDDCPIGALLIIRNITAEIGLKSKYKNRAKESITDALTQLYNRNYLEEFLQKQVNLYKEKIKANSVDESFCIAVIDIDFFKKINDVYGHQAGDYALKILATLMTKTFRKDDVICRFGGEEFIIVFSKTTVQGAKVALEKLRKLCEETALTFETHNFKMTVSSGVSEYLPGESIDETIARADAALYSSKEHGRNRVTVYQPQHSDLDESSQAV